MRSGLFLVAMVVLSAPMAQAQERAAGQPRVTPGPSEPDWIAILAGFYGIDMFEDLENPAVVPVEETPGLFRKAGSGPVRYTPLLALGLETTNRGGWYLPGTDPGKPRREELWNYTFRHTARDLERARPAPAPPPLGAGSRVEFDPGEGAFGLWISNDGMTDGGVFTEPAVVRAVNARLARQPYKAMIYRERDPATGRVIPNTYLIGWEYSTNDDFQDVVCRLENVVLVPRAGRDGGR